MGFLDDAIREHLDLKRRRGADPSEVDRAEREALGPVRRDPFEHAPDEPEGEVAGGEPAGAYDQGAEPDYELYEHGGEDWGDALEEEPVPPEAKPFSEELSNEEPAPAAAHPGDIGVGDETAEYDVEGTFADEHAHAPEPPAHDEPPHPAHEEPLSAAHEEAPATHEEPGEDDDVLEETPEFLQDAPEHDRLWFEQRPPRDFDFDG